MNINSSKNISIVILAALKRRIRNENIETAIVCEKLQKPEITKPHIIDFIKNFRNMNLDDLESKKRLIDSFVNSVFLYDDKILIAFNYNESTHTLNLKELEFETGSNLNALAPPRKQDPLQGLVFL